MPFDVFGMKGLGSFLCCITVSASLMGQNFKTLAIFDGSSGSSPGNGSLVQGTDGSFYGITRIGGANDEGAVFKVSPDGTLTTIYSFCRRHKCADGSVPIGGLALAFGNEEVFYGTTQTGGANDQGTVFKITPTGRLTTMYNFCSQPNCPDGALPDSTLIQSPTTGIFYGTTYMGGTSNDGTVFAITPQGTLTTLHTFTGTDGVTPIAGLTFGSDGLLYGTTQFGGAGLKIGKGAYGTVFKITTKGAFTSLHSFNLSNGIHPYGGVVQGSDGNFYGATAAGGQNGGGGFYKITSKGEYTRLYYFCSQADCADGGGPQDTLAQGMDGNFYGTTDTGGPGGIAAGTVFRITPTGTLTTIYNFCSEQSCADGRDPVAGLVQGTDGVLYGTTVGGGDDSSDCVSIGCGTVFSVDVGLAAFVEAVPYAAKVGRNIKILGQGFTGVTALSFNGAAANFTVKSDTYITTTVPNNATTGPLTVTTPSGVLTSNQPFRVIP